MGGVLLGRRIDRNSLPVIYQTGDIGFVCREHSNATAGAPTPLAVIGRKSLVPEGTPSAVGVRQVADPKGNPAWFSASCRMLGWERPVCCAKSEATLEIPEESPFVAVEDRHSPHSPRRP